jgi:hypothetical protein
MISEIQLSEWLSALPYGSSVGIDDSGLRLRVVRNGEVTSDYFYIGGIQDKLEERQHAELERPLSLTCDSVNEMRNEFRITIPVKNYDPDNFTFENEDYKVEIEANEEGIRIQLQSPNITEENHTDIYIEARSEGWNIYAHLDRDDEPAATWAIYNSGANLKSQTQTSSIVVRKETE